MMPLEYEIDVVALCSVEMFIQRSNAMSILNRFLSLYLSDPRCLDCVRLLCGKGRSRDYRGTRYGPGAPFP